MGRYYKRIGKILGILSGVCLVAVGGYLYWSYSLEDNVIWDPYVINDVSIQNMTKEEASLAIKEKFEQDYADSDIKINLAEKEYSINVFSLLSLDVENLIDAAYERGHGDWYRRGYEKWQLKEYEDTEIVYEIIPDAYETEKIHNLLEETGIQNIDTHKETEWELTENSLVIAKGKNGVVADMEMLEEEVLHLLQEKIYASEIDAPVIEIKPEEINIQEIEEEIHVEPVNSKYDKMFVPTEAVTGVSFDVKKAEQIFEEAEDGSEIVIEFVYTEPEVTREELTEQLFRDEMSSYQTNASTSNIGRATNITLAAQACNGTIVYPGEIFSYNETVGERTAEKGYQSAGVYANGQLVQGIGGGICQLSSTIYAATLNCGLEIIERHPHSGPVSYIPHGMDATVSWGLLDLKFKNNLEYPIRIDTSFESGIVNVKIVGTKTEELS